MLHPNRATVKMGKCLLQLKRDFIAPKGLLTQHVLTDYPVLPSLDDRFEDTCALKTLTSDRVKSVKRCGNTNFKENEHMCCQSTDFTTVVNSKLLFSTTISHKSNLIFITNVTPLQRSRRNFTVLSKSVDHKSLRTRNYCVHSASSNEKLTVTTRQYCTCPPKSPGRHLYHEETENAINQQISTELNACYAYLSMACYFGRTEVALPGCHGFFMKMHEEEHEHAQVFINYQNMRGGHVKLCTIIVPECQDWESIQKALAVAVEMEKLVKEKLISLHKIAEKHYDLNVMDLLATDFIQEQVRVLYDHYLYKLKYISVSLVDIVTSYVFGETKEQERSIQELSRLLIRATKMGSSAIAEYLFDKEVHRAFVKHFSQKLNVKLPTENKETKTNVYA